MFYDNQNEMLFGKIKDEYKGIPINECLIKIKNASFYDFA